MLVHITKFQKIKTSFPTIQCLLDGSGVGDCKVFPLAMHKNPTHANNAFSTTWINFCDHNDTGNCSSFQCAPWGNFYRPLVIESES